MIVLSEPVNLFGPSGLIISKKGFYLIMNASTTLQRVRDLAKSRVMELQPFAGEEMNLPQTDPHRDGFVAGERALATQILNLLEEEEITEIAEPLEEEMVLSLGRT
jgi:hypothetical protein